MSYRVVFNDELYHHGILGMKWGIRRYQNEDGTLTEEGKRRYLRDQEKAKRREYKKQLRDAAKRTYKMSDSELISAVNRLRLEKQLKDLTDELTTPGAKFVNKFENQISGIAVTAISGGLIYAGKVLLTGSGFHVKELAKGMFK